MKKKNRKAAAILLGLLLMCGLIGTGSIRTAAADDPYPDAVVLTLDGDQAAYNDEAVEEFDYIWHCDPGEVHEDVKNAPAEYFTGIEPDTDAPVYIDRALCYFPALDEKGFTKVNYDGEQEWAYYYTDGVNDDYIFATLPLLGKEFPSDMMHTEEEAAENKVLHITQPRTYILQGEWQGQINVDLGDEEDVFADETMKVTLVLDNADIECSVAPGIIFKSVYECDNEWEDREDFDADVNTENAGAVIVIADGSENTVTGTNVFRMLKTIYKNETSNDPVPLQKKMRKTDGALYSYMTMNILGEEKGDGSLTVNSGFEGIDSELHLNISGGNITVNSEDDGINVNEDDVSVVLFTGGDVTLNAALGAEGDGVDSNGFVKIDGSVIRVNGVRPPDSALDSEDGIYYESGTILIDDEEQTYEPGSVFRETGGFGGPGQGNFGGPDQGGLNMEPFGGMTPPEKPDGEDLGGPFGGIPGEGFGVPNEDPMGMPFNNEDFDLQAFKKAVAELPDNATLEDVLSLLGFGQ